MELRGHDVPGPWPIPRVRTPKASLLDSDVQGFLRTEDLGGDEPVSGPQLQWATRTECREVVRTHLVRDSTRRRERRHFLQYLQERSLAGEPLGAAHPSDSCR